jgi:hypothetical protein
MAAFHFPARRQRLGWTAWPWSIYALGTNDGTTSSTCSRYGASTSCLQSPRGVDEPIVGANAVLLGENATTRLGFSVPKPRRPLDWAEGGKSLYPQVQQGPRLSGTTCSIETDHVVFEISTGSIVQQLNTVGTPWASSDEEVRSAWNVACVDVASTRHGRSAFQTWLVGGRRAEIRHPKTSLRDCLAMHGLPKVQSWSMPPLPPVVRRYACHGRPCTGGSGQFRYTHELLFISRPHRDAKESTRQQ